MGTNKCASQAGMTAYGTRRHLYDPKMQTDKPFDQTTISLQMGTNKGASQVNSPVSTNNLRSAQCILPFVLRTPITKLQEFPTLTTMQSHIINLLCCSSTMDGSTMIFNRGKLQIIFDKRCTLPCSVDM